MRRRTAEITKQSIVFLEPRKLDPLQTAAALRYAVAEYGASLTRRGTDFIEEFADMIELTMFE
jgi:hypothetical protein